MSLPLGPQPLPLIGNLHQMLAHPTTFIDRLAEKYGNVFTYYVGAQRVIMVAGPEYNQYLLTAPANDFLNGPPGDLTGGPIFKGGILYTDGDEHKKLRRLMQPAFHKTAVNVYRDVIIAEADNHISHWTGEIDVAAEMKLLTLKIMARLLFGDTSHSETLRENYTRMLYGMGTLLGIIMARIPQSRRRRAAHEAERFIYEAIATRRSSPANAHDMLQMLLDAEDEDGNRLTDEEIKNQVLILLLAGNETSANALSWIFYLLAQHPDWATRVLSEVQSPPEYSAPDGPSIDMVIKEALRILPPAPGVAKMAAHDVELGNYLVPARTIVYYSIARTHHLPELYPDPECFSPLRFHPNAERKYSPYEYLPFGAGQRMCLGMPLAMLELPLIVRSVVGKYRLDLVAEQTINRAFHGISLEPRPGIRMTVHIQDGQVHKSQAPVYGNVPAAIDGKRLKR